MQDARLVGILNVFADRGSCGRGNRLPVTDGSLHEWFDARARFARQ